MPKGKQRQKRRQSNEEQAPKQHDGPAMRTRKRAQRGDAQTVSSQAAAPTSSHTISSPHQSTVQPHPQQSNQLATGPVLQLDSPILVDSEDEDVLVFRTSPSSKPCIHVGMRRAKEFAAHLGNQFCSTGKLLVRVEGFPKTGQTQLARYVLPLELVRQNTLRARINPPPVIYIDCHKARKLDTPTERYAYIASFWGCCEEKPDPYIWHMQFKESAYQVTEHMFVVLDEFASLFAGLTYSEAQGFAEVLKFLLMDGNSKLHFIVCGGEPYSLHNCLDLATPCGFSVYAPNVFMTTGLTEEQERSEWALYKQNALVLYDHLTDEKLEQHKLDISVLRGFCVPACVDFAVRQESDPFSITITPLVLQQYASLLRDMPYRDQAQEDLLSLSGGAFVDMKSVNHWQLHLALPHMVGVPSLKTPSGERHVWGDALLHQYLSQVLTSSEGKAVWRHADPWIPNDDLPTMQVALRQFSSITLRLAPFLIDTDKRAQLLQSVTGLSAKFNHLKDASKAQCQAAVKQLREHALPFPDAFCSSSAPGVTDVLCAVLDRVHSPFGQSETKIRLGAIRAGMLLFGNGELQFGRMLRFFQAVAGDLASEPRLAPTVDPNNPFLIDM